VFLPALIRRNQRFVDAVIQFHQRGELPANAYVLDLDTIEANTRLVVREAHRHRLTAYAMTKQIGRAPGALAAITAGGIDGYVAVDMACAHPIVANGHRLGHLGHLVQVPRHEAALAASYEPEHWTVFTRGKIREVSEAATAIGRNQPLLLRVFADGDRFYPGHEGGFPVHELMSVLELVDSSPGVSFAGLTTFPALLFDQSTGTVGATPNLATMVGAVEKLAAAGISDVVVNAPGTTSSSVLATLASMGATQVEPGHGLTGTTPLHALSDLPEIPAVLYVSEVAHIHQGRPYVYGGGLYIDPVFSEYPLDALVSRESANTGHLVPATIPDRSMIDYYAQLHPTDGPASARPEEGDTVVFGFRCQAFVTRALVAGVSGLHTGRPTVSGIWTSDGRPLDRHQSRDTRGSHS